MRHKIFWRPKKWSIKIYLDQISQVRRAMSISVSGLGVFAVVFAAVALAARYSEWVSVFVFFVISVGAVLIGFAVSVLAFLTRFEANSSVSTSSSPQYMDLPFCDDAVKEFIKVCSYRCRWSTPPFVPKSVCRQMWPVRCYFRSVVSTADNTGTRQR